MTFGKNWKPFNLLILHLGEFLETFFDLLQLLANTQQLLADNNFEGH